MTRPYQSADVIYYGPLLTVVRSLVSKREHIQYHETPWGFALDEKIFDADRQGVQVTKRDGWTAVAFTDNSVDKRPGSWSAFMVAKDWTAEQVLAEAEKQWPEVCGRSGFPLRPPQGVIEVE